VRIRSAPTSKATRTGFLVPSPVVDSVIEHDGGGLVFFLRGFPWINRQQVGGMIHGELALSDSINALNQPHGQALSDG
jgi:hypothetical protein